MDIGGLDAPIVAINIPGASGIPQIGTFLNFPLAGACANPIPSKFPSYAQAGAVLDPKRLLVGNTSYFGAAFSAASARKGRSYRSTRAARHLDRG